MEFTQQPKETSMKASDLFETKPCSRCGGSGHYSYNSMTGTVCFGCNGVGTQFTKAGKTARDAWVAEYTVLVAVRDLVPGDKVMVRGHGTRETVHVVSESGPDELNRKYRPDAWMVRFSSGQLGGHGFGSGDATLRLPASREDKREAYARIAHMAGALGWPEEEVA